MNPEQMPQSSPQEAPTLKTGEAPDKSGMYKRDTVVEQTVTPEQAQAQEQADKVREVELRGGIVEVHPVQQESPSIEEYLSDPVKMAKVQKEYDGILKRLEVLRAQGNLSENDQIEINALNNRMFNDLKPILEQSQQLKKAQEKPSTPPEPKGFLDKVKSWFS
jgi:hypothetical protein